MPLPPYLTLLDSAQQFTTVHVGFIVGFCGDFRDLFSHALNIILESNLEFFTFFIKKT